MIRRLVAIILAEIGSQFLLMAGLVDPTFWKWFEEMTKFSRPKKAESHIK